MTTKEVKEIIGNKITESQAALFVSAERLKIVYPYGIADYNPLHPAGEFLVILNSVQYSKSKNTASVVQDKDIRISVYAVVKYLEMGKSPEDYTDFLETALSGLRLTNNRAEKLVYPESTRFIKERDRYWWYEMVFVCPVTNLKGYSN
jgi:hypothetical protein